MTKKPIIGLLVMLIVAALLARSAIAQSSVTGDLAGAVVDPQGAVIAGANVTLTNSGTNESQTTQTNTYGRFRFLLLKPGNYNLRVQARGLATVEHQVSVTLGQIINVPVKLGIAGITTTVKVIEQAPLLQTENANLTTNYSTQQLTALPAPGGDFTSYAYSAPGIVMNSTSGGYGNFSAYGLPGTANLFTTNGNDNMDPYLNLNNTGASNLALGANELQQITVVTNAYTAQYGRQAGAQLNASTKSGTNAFHGNASYWWNGRVLNANEWFANHSDPITPRAFANNNLWAASFGGPIVKDKLFFFADQEGLRYVLPGAGGAIYLPTPQFSQYVLNNVNTTTPGSLPFYQKIFNLWSSAPGSNRAAALTTNDDPALGCGDFAGTAGFGDTIPCAMQFRSTQKNLNTEWLFSTRLDWIVNTKDHFFARFRTDHGVQASGTDPINPVFNSESVQPEFEGQLNETHLFSGAAVNQFIVSGMWYEALFGPKNLQSALGAFPTTMLFNDGLLTTLGGLDNFSPQGRIVTQYMFIDDFSKTKGTHDLRFGGNFRRELISDYGSGVNTSGTLIINSMSEFVAGRFMGNGSTYSQRFAQIGAVRVKMYNLGVYAQDQWKAASKLNLTLGLRVDNTGNPGCAQGCYTRLIGPFSELPHDATVPYNKIIQTGLNQAYQESQTWVWQPRLGAAYSLSPNTVLSGGIGVFSDLYPGVIVDRVINNAPNVATFSAGSTGAISPEVQNNIFSGVSANNTAFQTGFANGETLADLQKAVPGFTPPAFNTTGTKILSPKFLEWNVEVQQQWKDKYVLILNYVGNHGFDVMTDDPWLNAECLHNCPFGGVIPATTDPRFTQVRQITNAGWSNYSGLAASFKIRTGSSFQAQFNYTWSHALDTCSNNCLEQFALNTIGSMLYQASPTLPGTAYGNADYDVRQNVSANYVYNTKENWSKGLLTRVLAGWTVAGTIYFHSGYPYSVVSSGLRSYALLNVTQVRTANPLAEFLGGPVAAGNCSNPDTPCLTANQFLTRTQQTSFGNVPRNFFRAAGFFDTDLNVTKSFNLTDRLRFGVGANFFNLFNHPNFDMPVNNVSSGAFGLIQATVLPVTSPYGVGTPLTGRIIQLNARLTF